MAEIKNISAEIIADSINPQGNRLCTFIMRYPRFVHAELMTHRMFSRNAASSRAIPVKKMIQSLRDRPAIPEYWGSNKPGMQAGDQLEGQDLKEAKAVWNQAKDHSIWKAQGLVELGLHKQISNRILEPWMPYTCLVSATEWTNFFTLRAHPAALPEFQKLAYKALDAYLKHEPAKLKWWEWHIPFGDQMAASLDLDTKMKVATARSARLSYETFDGDISVDKDLELYERLMGTQPLHASPSEHVAQAEKHLWLNTDIEPIEWHPCGSWSDNFLMTDKEDTRFKKSYTLPLSVSGHDQGNFRGWTQWRKMQPHENVEKADLQAIMDTKPDWIDLDD